jgi:hypothetical protein
MFPAERKTPISFPLEELLDFTTAENAGGWKTADPNPAVPTKNNTKTKLEEKPSKLIPTQFNAKPASRSHETRVRSNQ